MHPSAILHEAQQLHNVSVHAEAIIAISGSVRNTATLLEVLYATKMALLSGLDPANA